LVSIATTHWIIHLASVGFAPDTLKAVWRLQDVNFKGTTPGDLSTESKFQIFFIVPEQRRLGGKSNIESQGCATKYYLRNLSPERRR
jgi:hypothetical protein